MLFKVLLVDEI